MASSGLHTFLTHHVSNRFGEHPFTLSALLSVIAGVGTDSTGMALRTSTP